MAHRKIQSVEIADSDGWWLPWSLAALAVLATVGALWNGYVYDDHWIILTNPRVHALGGLWRLFGQTYWPPSNAAALYRPIPMVGFTVAWVIGHGAPWALHALTVLLYVVVTLAVWRLARQILSTPGAWMAAALFAVHPVHVDATGNAVGQAELWSTLWCVVGVIIYLRWRGVDGAWMNPPRATSHPVALPRAGINPAPTITTNHPVDGAIDGANDVAAAVALAVCYALACCSKEHGVVFPALLLAAECCLVRDPRPWRDRVRELAFPFCLLVIVAGGYLVLRRLVVGSLAGDYPTFVFAHASLSVRAWTMLGAVMEWVRLFFWPVRLAAEYAPQEVKVYTGPAWPLVWPALIIAGTVWIASAARRRAPVVTFGVLWLVIALLPTSNILLVTGVIVAERTMFLASVGFVLVIGAGVAYVTGLEGRANGGSAVRTGGLNALPMSVRQGVVAVTALVLGAALVRSMLRQRDWQTDAMLIQRGVVDMPLSYRAHYTYGHLLFSNAQWVDGEREMLTAIALYPGDPQPYAELGTAYQEHGMCSRAEPLLRHVLTILPKHPEARFGLARCLLQDSDYVDARSQALIGVSNGYHVADFRGLLAAVDSTTTARRGH